MALAKLILLLTTLQVILTITFYQAVKYAIEIFTTVITILNVSLFILFSALTVFLSLILLSIIYKINQVRKK